MIDNVSLNRLSGVRQMLRTFGGLNEGYACSEAELTAEKNFSSREFPALVTRKPRAKVRAIPKLNGSYHLNGMFTVEGTSIRYEAEGGAVTTLPNAVTDSEKQLVGIGTKILIWPDKKAFDTATGKVSTLGAVWTNGTGTVEISPCDSAGKTYTVARYGRTEPTDPKDGQMFLKVASMDSPWQSSSLLEVYNAAQEKWVILTLDYCKITATGIGKLFQSSDTITLSGTAAGEADQWEALDGERSLIEVHDNWILTRATPGGTRFYGKLTHTGSTAKWVSLNGNDIVECGSSYAVRLERKIPDLDYLTECDNRVWGCASKENVVYACKLGDPTNWYDYRGIASDSYAVTLGSEGAFTGAATCLGYVLFFKENCIHKLYGTKPSDYQVAGIRCAGVASGANKSLRVMNEVLFYLSLDGVMVWDGSLPQSVSASLKGEKLARVVRATGGTLGERYYLYTTTAVNEQRLLVYDTTRGIWHEEDAIGQEMCSTGRQLYLWDGSILWAADPDREETDRETDTVDYELCTGDIGLDTPDDKYLSRVNVRLDALETGVVSLWVSYDGGAWEEAGHAQADEKYTRLNLPFAPARCDTLRLRLTGHGQIALRSIAMTVAAAGGNRVALSVKA